MSPPLRLLRAGAWRPWDSEKRPCSFTHENLGPPHPESARFKTVLPRLHLVSPLP